MPEGNVIDLRFLWSDPEWRWHVVVLIVVWAYLWASSCASLRFLRKQPDFEYKQAMMWGALWWPIIFTAIFISAFVIWYVSVKLTGQVPFLAFAILWTALLLTLQRSIGSWTLRGPGAITHVWSRRLKRDPIDLQQLIDEWEERHQWQLRWKGVILAFCAIPWAFFTGIWLLTVFLV